MKSSTTPHCSTCRSPSRRHQHPAVWMQVINIHQPDRGQQLEGIMAYTPRHSTPTKRTILRRSTILAVTCGLGLAALPAAPADARAFSTSQRATVTRYARAQVGDGYRFGASGPN